MAAIHLHRDELYNQIWTEPTTKLASKYGISDVGLSKICKKLKIPKPPVGYWSMIRSGEKITRPSLPKLKFGESESYSLTAQKDARPKIELRSEIQDYIEKEKNLRRRVIVSKKLTLPPRPRGGGCREVPLLIVLSHCWEIYLPAFRQLSNNCIISMRYH